MRESACDRLDASAAAIFTLYSLILLPLPPFFPHFVLKQLFRQEIKKSPFASIFCFKYWWH